MRIGGLCFFSLCIALAFALSSGVCHAQDIGEARAEAVAASLIGQAAPDVDIAMLDGETVKLGALMGRKPVYLKFWATWCVPCREQMAHLQSMYESFGDAIEIVAVNVGFNESLESVDAFRKKYNITVPIAFDADGRIGQAFDLTVTPQHVLIDRSRVIRYVGHLASAELDAAVASLIDGGDTQAAPPQVEPNPTETSHDEAIQLADGGRMSPGQVTGEPTVLFFFATWCDWYLADTRPAMSSACAAYQARVSALHAQYGDSFRWVGIAQNLWTSADDLEEYQARLNVAYPLGLDAHGHWFAQYGIREVPAVVLLNADGKVHSVIAGDVEELDAALSTFSTKVRG